MFLVMPLPNSIWRKFTAVVENAAPGRAPRVVARHCTAPRPPPPSLLLSWRNTRILLQPLLFCIFGMCSPRRKSAATVRTVQKYSPFDSAGGGGEACMRFGLAHFLNAFSFLMISPNLHDIWAMFFLILSHCETLHFFIVLRT